MYHNDYVLAAKQYLIQYTELSTYIDSVKTDIADYEEKLKLDALLRHPA